MTGTPFAAPCPSEETLLAFAHGELPVTEALPVQAHLRDCSRCAEEITVMKTITAEVGNLAEAAEVPTGLRGRVLSRLRFRERRRWNLFDSIRLGAAGGAAAVAATVLLMMLPRSSSRMALAPSSPVAGLPTDNAKASSGTASSAFNDGHLKRAVPEAPSLTAPAFIDLSRTSPSVLGGSMGGYPGGGAGGHPATAGVLPEGRARRQEQLRFSQPSNGLPSTRHGVSAGGPEITPDDVRRYTHGEAIEDPKRKVVHSLTLGVRVNRALEGVQDEITARVRKEGGYVEDASLNAPPESERTAEMTLRVPVDQLDAVTRWLSGLGEVKAKSASGEDVTGTWVDQRAELREFRKEEERLQKEYDHAKTASAREAVRYQLLALRTRIRSSEERFALTTKLAALATIRLSLTEEPQARVRGSLLPDMDNTFKSAVSAFMIAVRVPLGVLIWLAVFSPLWVPCVLLYRWATRKALERDLASRPAA